MSESQSTWFVKDEIRKYCKKASDVDATSIYTPLFAGGKWKLVIKPKPGKKFEAVSHEFGHPFDLYKMVESLSIASRLYPSQPISSSPERMLRVFEEITRVNAQKDRADKDWERALRAWKPGGMA